MKDSVTPCPYLPDREFTAENFIAPALGPDEIDSLLEAGFRHFGSYYFRPVCSGCHRCVPLRVVVKEHANSRSERRMLRQNRDLVVDIGTPTPSRRAFELYQLHQERFERQSPSSYEQFVYAFHSPTFGNNQLSVYLEGTLVSVLHLDITGTSISAVYCYYDTALADRSLGTYSILTGLHLAERLGVARYYLGYLVSGNRHMEYKERFRPNEVLVADGWVSFKTAAGATGHPGQYEAGFPGAEFRARRPFSRILHSTK